MILPPLLQALEKFNIEKDIAAFIKKEFDKVRLKCQHVLARLALQQAVNACKGGRASLRCVRVRVRVRVRAHVCVYVCVCVCVCVRV